MTAVEVNYDGLIGPTHNYGGLAFGNLASARNQGALAHPRAAALQGLAKMRALMDQGLVQGVLPPHERPSLAFLREVGFTGPDAQVWADAWTQAPGLAKAACSASAMWTANAATVSPSADTAEGRLHLTPANLVSHLHRSLEATQTTRALRTALPFAEVHDPLPRQAVFADEGAANHIRLCAEFGAPGVEVFVYGQAAGRDSGPRRFAARQTLEACQAIARRHGLDPKHTVFARQSPEAIDAGAFHNDVVSVGTLDTVFFHERAFADPQAVREAIREAAAGLFEPRFVEVPDADVPLADAIGSYLFNSQLLAIPGADRLTLLAPTETRDTPSTAAYCDALVQANGPIGGVDYVDVRQSMKNGGGPACLRLRVVLTKAELAQAHPGFLLTPARADALEAWVNRHYRETLAPEDLRDPALIEETRMALDALCEIMELGGGFYPFQQD
ncbi:MAG: N-succinylarginine dihydrolase [Maricaulaceae bacterium]